MKIALTGGTGYVGQFILAAARGAGHDVTLLTRRGTGADDHIPWSLGEAPPLAGFDALIHAAFDHVPGKYRRGEGSDPAGFLRRNLNGTQTLFDAAARGGVGRIVFLSSRAVYGDYPPGTTLDEDMPLRPDTLYGTVKAGGEAALADLAPGLDVAASLRATGVYGRAGPGLPHKWEGLFADFLAGRPISPRAGTELHGEDLARAILLLLTGRHHGVWNLSDILIDRHDLLREVARVAGRDLPLPARSGAPVSAMTTGRMGRLGWVPRGWDGLCRTLPDLVFAGSGRPG
ncbi:NAD-dependent epimerase/dehydratase family protein [Halodurantibacterium flavum]|uniref:NAD-dependent epimerase/dehydratase family protein n=1 Tax=Halodurantibacterium flavum TaxID=1382802 RepID=A0ABW4S6D3_9RHOB